MKIKITFKDPDGVSEAIRQHVEDQVSELDGIDDNEKESIIEHRCKTVEESLASWIKYNEYLIVEFDTMARTATVVKYP